MDIVHNIPNQKNKRKYLRNNATEFEKLFWQEINNNQVGYKFRRQHGVKNYIVDFPACRQAGIARN